jgi:hypothetical protein
MAAVASAAIPSTVHASTALKNSPVEVGDGETEAVVHAEN